MKITTLYIPCPNKNWAKKIANHLISNQLIACANIHSIDSLYMWEGALQDEQEFVILAKSSPTHLNEIEKVTQEIHPYDIACILSQEVNVNDAYGEWLQQQIKD